MERAEAEAVYDAGREACVEFLVELSARYERQIARLEARIERLEERLRENSQNSSCPPSQDPPGARRRERSPTGRPPGGQPGHEGTTRKLVCDSELDRIVDHWPGCCSGCGHLFGRRERETAAAPHRHQVFELPEIAVEISEHRAHRVRCARCGRETRAELAEGVPRSAFGPRLQAAIALLSVRNGVSRRDLAELSSELFGCPISVGSVDALCQRTSSALAVPYGELRAEVKDAEVVCVDETGWRQAGERRTLWGAFSDRHAAFHIAADRHERELPELIGERFAGIVSSDRWWAYDQLDPARRQVCWAHLLRDFRRHSEGLPHQQRFGERGLEICRQLFAAWDEFADRGERAELQAQIAPLKRELRTLLQRATDQEHQEPLHPHLRAQPAQALAGALDLRRARRRAPHQQRRRARPARRRHLPQGLARQPVRPRRALRRADAVGLPDLPPPAPLAIHLPHRRHRRPSPRQPSTLTRLTSAGG